MVGILVMMNNYFHDFATALVVVCTYGMLMMVRYVERSGGEESRRMVLALYPRMVHLTGGSVVFVMLAGVVRAFTYGDYEWQSAVSNNQVAALMVKHVILFALFFYGLGLWVKVHRKIREFRMAQGKS
ncbi:MAG TPA: hypothetical protein ENJ37_05825 [Deltaproteobacteria bacterium]|nr:hypothetical protein [Deltaproteobacteria bacterium]